MLAAVVNLYAAYSDRKAQEMSPQVDCTGTTEISEQMAIEDSNRESSLRKGFLHCYCQNLYLENYQNKDHKYPNVCEEWLKTYVLTQSLVYVAPIVIGFINFIAGTVMTRISKYEKKHTIPEMQYTAARNNAFISFVNLGLAGLLVNLKMPFSMPQNFPLLQGQYDEFSVEWYRLLGSSLCVQLALLIVSNHAAKLVKVLIKQTQRCWDRGCTCNRRRTKRLSQSEYEKINFGSDFNVETKYASMLLVVLMAMTFGPGLPIMYLIAMVYFFVTYWVDKAMMIYYEQKPVFLDEQLAISITKWYKVGILFHLVLGVLMFSNANILPSGERAKSMPRFQEYLETAR